MTLVKKVSLIKTRIKARTKARIKTNRPNQNKRQQISQSLNLPRMRVMWNNRLRQNQKKWMAIPWIQAMQIHQTRHQRPRA